MEPRTLAAVWGSWVLGAETESHLVLQSRMQEGDGQGPKKRRLAPPGMAYRHPNSLEYKCGLCARAGGRETRRWAIVVRSFLSKGAESAGAPFSLVSHQTKQISMPSPSLKWVLLFDLDSQLSIWVP